MKYRVLRTDKAHDQLASAIQYIAEDSGSVDIALDYLDALEAAVRTLESTPHMGSYPRYSILKKQGYRVLIVRQHLIFYKVDDEKREVMIHAVVDARQHYVNLI